MDESINVKSEHFEARYTLDSSYSLAMQRVISYPEEYRQYDVNGDYLICASADVREGEISYYRDGALWPLCGKILAIHPPFSITDWLLKTEKLTLDCRFYLFDDYEFFPAEPIVLNWNGAELPRTKAQLRDVIGSASKIIPIGNCSKPGGVARRFKKRIDETYDQNTKLDKIARSLNVSLTVAGRLFKKYYGSTPAEYRGKLRSADALRHLIFENNSIGQITESLGFSNPSSFFRQFKKYHSVNPSSYKT